MTILPKTFWTLVMAGALAMLLYPLSVKADPLVAAEEGGVRLVIHTETCALPAISNLPRRATYHEKGQSYEGCAGLDQNGLMLFYFEDKTVFAVPANSFKRVVGA